jgi:hypothetical protein
MVAYDVSQIPDVGARCETPHTLDEDAQGRRLSVFFTMRVQTKWGIWRRRPEYQGDIHVWHAFCLISLRVCHSEIWI